MNVHHDRDRRTLLRFPLEFMNTDNICIARVSHSCRYTTHLTNSTQRSEQWIYLISYQAHMRAMYCANPSHAAVLRSFPKTATAPLGWETFPILYSPSVYIDSGNLSRCPHCQAPNLRLPLGVEGALVGRAMILGDRRLRLFHVNKPWTLEQSTKHIPEAQESWMYEQDSPLLDVPPELSKNPRRYLAKLMNYIHPEDSAFAFLTWQTIAAKTDAFIASVGDVFSAAHAYTAFWRSNRNPTTMAPSGLRLFGGIVAHLYTNTHHEWPFMGRYLVVTGRLSGSNRPRTPM